MSAVRLLSAAMRRCLRVASLDNRALDRMWPATRRDLEHAGLVECGPHGWVLTEAGVEMAVALEEEVDRG